MEEIVELHLVDSHACLRLDVLQVMKTMPTWVSISTTFKHSTNLVLLSRNGKVGYPGHDEMLPYPCLGKHIVRKSYVYILSLCVVAVRGEAELDSLQSGHGRA